MQQIMDIWKFLSGQDPKGVRGTKKFVGMQQAVDIWKYLSGQDPKVVRGMEILVCMRNGQLEVLKWARNNGCGI